MRKILITAYLTIIGVNSIAGLLLTNYRYFNWICADISLLISLVLNLALNSSSAKDGFKVSLNFLLLFFSILTFSISILLDSEIIDNWLLLILIGSVSVQILMVLLSKYFSAIIKLK